MILTINGIKHYNDNLFSQLIVPDSVNKDALIGRICADCASYELIYPDAFLMEELIGYWSAAHMVEWNKLAMIIESDFNPIEDYRRNVTKINKGSSSSTNEAETNSTDTNESTSLNRVAAYDSNDMENREQNDDTNNSAGTVNSKNDGSAEYQDEEIINESGYRGNIAVLLKNAIETYETANIYDVILKEFKREFCILVY